MIIKILPDSTVKEISVVVVVVINGFSGINGPFSGHIFEINLMLCKSSLTRSVTGYVSNLAQ